MCEFCHKHGEGKKWYLQAKNYAEDLLSDADRRQFIRQFAREADHLRENVDQLAKLRRAPAFIQRMVKASVTRTQKKQHFGQVVPIEEIKQIFGFANSIVRIACICRYATMGERARYCYGMSTGPGASSMESILGDVDDSYLGGPDTDRFENLTPDEAIRAFEEHEREGLCHTVWTFITPYIGGICNCDRAECLAMRATVTHDVKVMFRAEYVAEVNPDACSGCRSCMRLCQFGALAYSAARKKAHVDQYACYGCGICRSVCTKEAIRLVPRADVAAVATMF